MMAKRVNAAKNASIGGRIDALDLARGIAVLGILAINIATFAGPPLAAGMPAWPGNWTQIDELSFGIGWIVFEGKMRGLFTLLFGASLATFFDRRGGGATAVKIQLRRLTWLAVFGYAHFLFFWWGDILFLYAVAGLCALPFLLMPARQLIGGAIGLLILGSMVFATIALPTLVAIDQRADGTASNEQIERLAQYEATESARANAALREMGAPMAGQIAYRLSEKPFYPVHNLPISLLETFPLVLLGMGLARSGLFVGGWSRGMIWTIAAGGITVGLAWSAVGLSWLHTLGYPVGAAALLPYFAGLPGRVAASVGYLIVIAALAPAISRTGIGKRLRAAGRMAFSNYLLTTIVMTFLFHGWGLRLMDAGYGHAALMPFVIAGWIGMLAWSPAWQARFGMGPLEWVWRRLTYAGLHH